MLQVMWALGPLEFETDLNLPAYTDTDMQHQTFVEPF